MPKLIIGKIDNLNVADNHAHACHGYGGCASCANGDMQSIELTVAGLIKPNQNTDDNGKQIHPHFKVKNSSGAIIYEQ